MYRDTSGNGSLLGKQRVDHAGNMVLLGLRQIADGAELLLDFRHRAGLGFRLANPEQFLNRNIEPRFRVSFRIKTIVSAQQSTSRILARDLVAMASMQRKRGSKHRLKILAGP